MYSVLNYFVQMVNMWQMNGSHLVIQIVYQKGIVLYSIDCYTIEY